MNIQLFAAIPLLALSPFAALSQTSSAQSAPVSPISQTKQKALVAANYGKLPLSFETNQGQFDPQVKFLSRGSGYRLLLTDSAAVLELSKPGAVSHAQPGSTSARGAKAKSPTAKTDFIRMELPGAASGVKVVGDEQLPGKANYFVGSDSSKWHTNIPTYSKVKYTGVYPGVDLVYYGNQRQLEYDFIVAPGASPKPVKLHFAGASKLKLNADGDLQIIGNNGEIAFHKPIVYQEKAGQREPVDGRFKLMANNTVGFALGDYDRSREVVIDPILSYSTYLGGSDNFNFATVGPGGEVYLLAGNYTAPQAGFSPTYGAYGEGSDQIVVLKLNPAGTAVVYIAAFGNHNGPYLYDAGIELAVDTAGNAYIAGEAGIGDNFPTTPGAFQRVNKATGYTAFVTKLNPTGSDLVYSTLLGGTSDDYATSIAIDPSGNAYVTGYAGSPDFPITSGAFQTVNKSGGDCFVTKLNASGSALIYSTFLGGSQIDQASGIVLDSAGEAYVAGSTDSSDFPVTPGAYLTTNKFDYGYPYGGFVSKLNADGSGLIYSTYFSRGSLAIDPAGNAYVAGLAYNDPPDVFSVAPTPGAFQSKLGSQQSGYITKLNATGTAVVYSTYLGGSKASALTAIAVDPKGDAFVTGYTSDSNFPVTADAYQTTSPPKIQDAVFTELNPAGSALVYSTYLGGSAGAFGIFVALDSLENAYVVGSTPSTDFPVTPGAWLASGTGFISRFVFNGATTTTVSADNTSEPVGTNVTFTAHVAASDGSRPSGALEFHVDGTLEEYANPDDSGNASYSTAGLALGAHAIEALYRGDPSQAASSGTLTETITGNQVATPYFSPVSGIYPSYSYLNPVYTYATIISETAGAVIHYTTDGTMPSASSPVYSAPIFLYDTTTIKAIALASGDAPSQIGTASYQFSDTLPRTRTTLTSSAIALTPGEPVTLRATVQTSDGTVATGAITFRHGSVPLATVPLVGGAASLTTSALVNTGVYSITAAYGGSSTETGGQSPTLLIKVSQ
jgi:hypothetical protein